MYGFKVKGPPDTTGCASAAETGFGGVMKEYCDTHQVLRMFACPICLDEYQKKQLVERDERIRELEQRLEAAESGWDAAHEAAMHYMNEGCNQCEQREQQLKAAQECCVQHDTVVQEIVDAKVVWATEDTPFTGPEVLELLQENERLRASGKAAQDAANYMHRSYHAIIDGECSYCEYFGPTREFRGRQS